MCFDGNPSELSAEGCAYKVSNFCHREGGF